MLGFKTKFLTELYCFVVPPPPHLEIQKEKKKKTPHHQLTVPGILRWSPIQALARPNPA